MLLKETIKGFSVFKGFDSRELDKIIPLCREKIYNEHDVILEEDTKGSNFYIILEGKLNVEIKSSSPQHYENISRHLTTLREGDIFGEISFLEKGRRKARVIAMSKIHAIDIEGTSLYELFEKDTRLGYLMMRNIASILARRLFDINFKLRDNN